MNHLRQLLCHLGDHIRSPVLRVREESLTTDLTAVAAVTAADTIYAIDKISEEAILGWFQEHWPKEEPVQLVMEGIEDSELVTFPTGTSLEGTRWKCILDPIDGTRCLMYDKRSAWALTALAPQKGAATSLKDVVVAAMTELPTSKQTGVDQMSAVRGRGLVMERMDLITGAKTLCQPRPSTARDYRHGFASLAKFFPESKGITAQLEEALWRELLGSGNASGALIFDDQYLSSGGQIYEILCGHDRMIGDLRPLAFRQLGMTDALSCHPYDICTAMLLEEAGGIVEKPLGGALDAPLDTTTPVSWVAYANPFLASLTRPVLQRLIREFFPMAAKEVG